MAPIHSLSLFSFEWKESMTLSNTIVRLRMCEKKSHGKFLFFHTFLMMKKRRVACARISWPKRLMINSVILRLKMIVSSEKKFRIISCRDWIYYFIFWFHVTIRRIFLLMMMTLLGDEQFTLFTNCSCRDICHHHHHHHHK